MRDEFAEDCAHHHLNPCEPSATPCSHAADGLARKTQTEILGTILYNTITRRETSIEPDGMANKFKREALVLEGDGVKCAINKSN